MSSTAPPATLKALVKPPADRQGAGGFPGRLGQDRPEDRLTHHRATPRQSLRQFSRRWMAAGRSSLSPRADADFTDGRRLCGDGEAARAAHGARRKAGRPQDRLHQPQYLVRIRRLRADLGRCLRHHGDGRSRRATRSRCRNCPEPRIEPEIVLGLARDLTPGMGLAEIAQAVGWVAHGFESCSRSSRAGVSRPPTALPTAACTAGCSSGRGVNCRIGNAARWQPTFPA